MATAAKHAAKPAPKTRAPKAATKPASAELQQLAPTALTTVAYGRLKRAPQNVRKTNIAADVESLAEDIAAHGLLQSLIGYAGTTKIDAQAVYVVGGGRRLQALELLRERGTIDEGWPVPVLIRSEDEAIELSLSENLARRDMNPADEFVAFAALMAPGTKSPADLAKQFGFTERYVKQRLRLAGLADEIMDELRNGDMSLESAIAYATTTDRVIQLKIFKAQMRPNNSWNRHQASNVKTMIASENLSEASPIFQFIDRDTYEREGGGYQEDLFGELIDAELAQRAPRKLTHGTLAQEIADRCLRFQAGRVLAQAERDLPSVAGYVIPADLLIGGKVDVPSGCVTVASGWDSKLGMNVEIDECWKRAIAASVPMHIEIGIARDEPIGEDDDGSPLGYVARRGRSRFFVPRDAAAKVLPKREPVNYGGGKVLTDEERRAQELERDARLWAARLSIPRFSDIPGFEGRVFYDRDWLDNHLHRPGDPKTGPRTPSFELRVFVTEDEIAANMDAGRVAAIEQRERIERFKAEQAAAREQAEQEKEARWKELCALDPAPEVLLDERGDLWVKTDQGWTIEGEEDEVGYAEEFADLLEEFGPGDITEWWATRADYDQAHPVGAPDEEVGS